MSNCRGFPHERLHQDKAPLSYGNFKPAKTDVYNGSPLPVFKMDQRKLLSLLCHGSIFFSSLVVSIAIPIVIFLVTEDSVVKEN
ncbi:MAG: DUF4870 domain-containing protein, partial [Moorea sp. SIO4E2]|nr:DUF4870 domain-containing protein [Moorena sp. SIO4E2]